MGSDEWRCVLDNGQGQGAFAFGATKEDALKCAREEWDNALGWHDKEPKSIRYFRESDGQEG